MRSSYYYVYYVYCCRVLAVIPIVALIVVLIVAPLALAENTPPAKISKTTREEIIHTFNEDLVYIRTPFPMGKTGLKLRNGTVIPNGEELKHLMALWGPAAKAG